MEPLVYLGSKHWDPALIHLCFEMANTFRGEIWFRFGELPGSSSNQPGYVFSTGSFGSNLPIDIDTSAPFVVLQHANDRRTIIYTIQFDGTNVQQAHIPELSSGLAYGATGAVEINTVAGSRLYYIYDGVASYNSGTGKIRITLHTDQGRPPSA